MHFTFTQFCIALGLGAIAWALIDWASGEGGGKWKK